MVLGGDWTIEGLKPSYIVGVTVKFPDITLKCIAASKEQGGKYNTTLDEIYSFEKKKAITVEEVKLLNGGTIVWADRQHNLLPITDGINKFYGVVEDVDYSIDEYGDDIMEYEIKLKIQLPSKMELIGSTYYFDSEVFSPNIFFL